MKRSTFLAAAVIAFWGCTAAAQQQRSKSEAGWRPAWGRDLPETAPQGSIGVLASVFDRNPFGCILSVQFENSTDATIRYAVADIEVFFGQSSVVSSFAIQYADPGRWREAKAVLSVPCPRTPTKLVLRAVGLCTRGQPSFSGCGAPFVAVAPRLQREVSQFPVEIAPELAR